MCFMLVESTICPWGVSYNLIFMIRSLNLLKHLFYAVLINAMIAALICSGSSGQTVKISDKSRGSFWVSIFGCSLKAGVNFGVNADFELS